MNGMLLAAGLGTRFRPHTDILAKPAIPLLNIPTAYYNLHLIQQLGIDQLVVNTHHKAETVKKIFQSPEKILSPVHFSDETGEILGTGGAVKRARKYLEGSGTFVLANADVVTVIPLKEALKFHHDQQPMATMLVMKHPDAGTKYGAVWVDKNKKVKAIGKTSPGAGTKPFHFVGIHFLEESVFKYIPDGPCDINKDVYAKAMAAGEDVLAYEVKGLWLDSGSLSDYLGATKAVLQLLPRLQHQPFFLSLFRRFWARFDQRPNLWEGEGCEHLIELGAKNHTLMGQNCKIHTSVHLQGFAVFGDGCQIEKDVVIKNSVIGAGVHVPAGAKITDSLVLK